MDALQDIINKLNQEDDQEIAAAASIMLQHYIGLFTSELIKYVHNVHFQELDILIKNNDWYGLMMNNNWRLILATCLQDSKPKINNCCSRFSFHFPEKINEIIKKYNKSPI